jgi:hypothetical protein
MIMFMGKPNISRFRKRPSMLLTTASANEKAGYIDLGPVTVGLAESTEERQGLSVQDYTGGLNAGVSAWHSGQRSCTVAGR